MRGLLTVREDEKLDIGPPLTCMYMTKEARDRMNRAGFVGGSNS